MPGDPKDRQHAERCAELARLARTAKDRDKFLSLQMIWIRLALELDEAGALIKAMQELTKSHRSRLLSRRKGRRPKPTPYCKSKLLTAFLHISCRRHPRLCRLSRS